MARRSGSWLVYALIALLLGAIAAAVLVVGPASGVQTSATTRTVIAQRGVVQSTVSGSGNVEAASELDLGFKTSGTVTAIDVTQGERVAEGQLIATLDPQSAEVTLEQAKASLQAAEATLSREEETDGESSGLGSAGSGSGSGGAAAASSAASSTSTGTTRGSSPSPSSPKANGGSTGGGSTGGGSTSGATISTATREANIASARAAVKSDRLTVKSDEQSVADTRLVAPESGTIVALSGEVGETVSGGGTSRASSSSPGSSSGGEGASGTSGRGSAIAGAGSSSSSSSSGSSGSSGSTFAVLSDLSAMKLVVPLSESEVGSVEIGQPATVAIEALKGAKVAAHVSEVAALPTSNSGVVSYDVTFSLDQLETGLKPGMSATAEVVVSQAEGVNVPTSAISGGSVTVMRDGRQERRSVSTGLAGDSTTIVLGGLNAGERVLLPLASTSGTSSLLSRLAGRGGTGALGGGLGGGAGGGAALGGGGLGGGGFARRALGAGAGG